MKLASTFPPLNELASIVRAWPILLASITHIRYAVSQQTIASPQLSLGDLGEVALGGDFDAISIYTHQGQSENPKSGQQSILAALPDGDFASLAVADAHITAMCNYFYQAQFIGVVVGGNFTSFGGIDTQAVALFDPQHSTVVALPGIQGTVSSLLCDPGVVYVGGQFKAAGSNNAIAWVGGAPPMPGRGGGGGSWTNLPFAGFNGPVTSIAKAPNGHIVFGGSFSGLGNTTAPEPKDNQVVNLNSAQLTATGSTENSQFSDPRNVLCPNNGTDGPGRTWLLADNQAGSWQADMKFGYNPTKLRLWNTNQDGRGTRTFRFVNVNSTGIMHLTTTDPDTGDRVSCSNECTLAQGNSTSFQDFSFEPSVGMQGFRIDISAWYGDGGGLNGVELFEDDIFAYAINDFNEPNCPGINFGSTATVSGPWQTIPKPRNGQSDYLSADVGSADVSATSVVFKPDISQSGNYTITIFTPGCDNDKSCPSRGQVNITANLGSSGTTPSEPLSTQLFQTNDFDKYDQVFMSYIQASTDSFRPTVTLTPELGSLSMTVVASRVKFELISNTGGLNGLFDYDPNMAVVNTDFSKSAINRAGTELKEGAAVASLSTVGDTIFAGGKFSDDVLENILAFRDNNATSLQDGGLNGAVSALFNTSDLLYLGGNFTNTSNSNIGGLNNAASWSLSQNDWVPLGAGLNGRVNTVVPLQINVTGSQPETTITFSGDFDQILAFGGFPARSVQGFAIWVPSKKNWLQNLDIQRTELQGQLSASVVLANNTQYVAGSLFSRGLAISGAVELEGAKTVSLRSLGANIRPTAAQNSLRKRALNTTEGLTGVVTGRFVDPHGRNITVLGGHFTATATNGSTINNLIFVNGSNNDAVTGLPPGIGGNATFLSTDTQNNVLFAGGSFSGQVKNADVSGLVAFDLASGEFAVNQPPALSGDNVIVNAVATRPDSSDVYVGGSFDTAGSLGCPSVCVFQVSNNQWVRPGAAIDGDVATLRWTSNSKLIAAGNLRVNGYSTYIATYDTKKKQWSAVATDSVPGPVTAFTPQTADGSRFWIAGTASNGSTYLMEKNGNSFTSVGNSFGPNTDLRGLQILSLSKSHDHSDLLEDDQTLLVTGLLELPGFGNGFGNVSAALFDGKSFSPFILSTKENGDPGSLSQLWSSKNPSLQGGGSKHSNGIVILVALCAALGCIFLIILAGIITDRVQRRRAGYSSIPTAYNDKHSNLGRVPPEHLFSQLGNDGRGGPPTV